jgi:solute carrier family 25 folate transporter 32
MCAAATAAVASNVCTNPFWVIKTRMMTQGAHTDYRYQHTFQAFKMIWKEEGIRGYYKGLGTSFIGIAHVAVQLPLYERLKVWLSK